MKEAYTGEEMREFAERSAKGIADAARSSLQVIIDKYDLPQEEATKVFIGAFGKALARQMLEEMTKR